MEEARPNRTKPLQSRGFESGRCLLIPLRSDCSPTPHQHTDFCLVVQIGAFDRVVRFIYYWWLKVSGVLVDHRVVNIGAGGIFSVEAHSIANYLWVRAHVYEIESRAIRHAGTVASWSRRASLTASRLTTEASKLLARLCPMVLFPEKDRPQRTISTAEEFTLRR